ncbi:MAG: hypothetical protein IPL46_01965 [Saprospiraceae bacterium]|nr:hypothetical protein [Saprospiraceae bacterium]
MSLQDCFAHPFQKAQGEDPDLILKTIQDNRLTQYHVESTGFNETLLKGFIAEKNCAVVFFSNDGFNTNFRLNFIDHIPVSASKTDVVIVDSNFSQSELSQYAARLASIMVCDRTSSLGNLFVLMSFAKRFPRQVTIRSKAFTKPQLDHMLPLTEIQVVVEKDDFPDPDINSFIDIAGSRIAIERTGFSENELQTFKDRGASLIRESV